MGLLLLSFCIFAHQFIRLDNFIKILPLIISLFFFVWILINFWIQINDQKWGMYSWYFMKCQYELKMGPGKYGGGILEPIDVKS